MMFDVVITGSSPVCILEAIYRKQAGENVCIIDKAPLSGGAWKMLDGQHDRIKGVEIGCHILEKDRKVFSFFKKNMGLSLQPMEPQPGILFEKKTVPYHYKNYIFLFRDLKFYFTQPYGLRQLGTNLYLFFNEILHTGVKYQTFEKASVTLVEKLYDELVKNNIPLYTSTEIEKVNTDVSSGIVNIALASGQYWQTKKIIVSYSTHIPSFTINNTPVKKMRGGHELEFVHVHLLLHEPRPVRFSYQRIYRNEMIHRVSDMSSQINLPPDHKLYCVGIFSSFMKNRRPEDVLSLIIKNLGELGILSAGASVVASRWNSYTTLTTDLNDLKKMAARTKGLAEVLYTMDTSQGIRKNLHKFRKIRFS